MERFVKFEVLGQEISLHTDAPEDEVTEILDLVRSQLEQNSKTSTILPTKVAVLVSLNIAGKYVRLKKEFEKLEAEYQERVTSLIGKIEGVL